VTLVKNAAMPPPRRDTTGSVRRGRVERRKARTRAALLAAARRLYAAQGVEPTTISEIAEAADIAVGSFYNYFATKDELLDALLEEELSEQLLRLELRQAQVEDPAEKISVAHRHLVRAAQSDPEWAWLMVRLEIPYRVAWSVLGEAAARDLRSGIRAGRFEVSNPALTLTASGGALFAVIHEQLVDAKAARADIAHAEGVLRSLGLDRADAAEDARRPLPDAIGPEDAEPAP
jgi:AcrR family transcriptional regulator